MAKSKMGMGAGMSALPSKASGYKGKSPMYEGQLKGDGSTAQSFGEPMNVFATEIVGMDSSMMAGNEMVGFTTQGYIDKQGMPYGESVKLNFMPPGMDISNQENAEIHRMELKTLTSMSYPGDGWIPTPRDIPE